MNERIGELAVKANSQNGNEFDLNYKALDALLEKFAELVVRECIDIAYREGDNVAYLANYFRS